MKLNFEECLAKNRLVRVKPDKDIASSELKEAEDDLKGAEHDFAQKSWKWATDKAYYAMFHAARGLLYLKGYKEQSHVCLIIAVKELFVKEGILPFHLLEFLISGKSRREDAIYASKYSEEIAKTHIAGAKEFIKKAGELVKAHLENN